MLLCNFVLRTICLSTFSHDAVRILASPESIARGTPNCKTEELIIIFSFFTQDTSSSGVSSMDSGDPTNNNRFSFGGYDDVFGPDGSLDFSNIAPKTYKEPEWKRTLSIDDSAEPEVTVKAVYIEQEHSVQLESSESQFNQSTEGLVRAVPRTEGLVTAVPRTEGLVTAVPRTEGSVTAVQRHSAQLESRVARESGQSTEGLVTAVPRRSSRMERRRHPNALKPHMRSQSVPEQMMGQMDDEEPEQEMWMSVSMMLSFIRADLFNISINFQWGVTFLLIWLVRKVIWTSIN